MSVWFWGFLVGVATGILSGFGVGGGSLLLIYLTAFAAVPQQEAQGINLIYFLPAALAALPSHFKNGYVEKPVAAYAIAGGLLCSALAALLSNRLDVALLRKLFGVFLLVIGIWELIRKEPPPPEIKEERKPSS